MTTPVNQLDTFSGPFALADLRGIGRMDLVAPGKEGLSVFFNEGV